MDDQTFLDFWQRRWFEGLAVTYLARGTVTVPALYGAMECMRGWGYRSEEILAIVRKAETVAFRPDPRRRTMLDQLLQDTEGE